MHCLTTVATAVLLPAENPALQGLPSSRKLATWKGEDGCLNATIAPTSLTGQ